MLSQTELDGVREVSVCVRTASCFSTWCRSVCWTPPHDTKLQKNGRNGGAEGHRFRALRSCAHTDPRIVLRKNKKHARSARRDARVQKPNSARTPDAKTAPISDKNRARHLCFIAWRVSLVFFSESWQLGQTARCRKTGCARFRRAWCHLHTRERVPLPGAQPGSITINMRLPRATISA